MTTYVVTLWTPGGKIVELLIKDDGLKPGDTTARFRREQLPGFLYGSSPGHRVMSIIEQ